MKADKSSPTKLDCDLAPQLDESDDHHAGSMRSTTASVTELVERGRERRRTGVDLAEGTRFAAARDRSMFRALGGGLSYAASRLGARRHGDAKATEPTPRPT